MNSTNRWKLFKRVGCVIATLIFSLNLNADAISPSNSGINDNKQFIPHTGEGKATISPSAVIVGKFYSFSIRFYVGVHGLKEGAKIRFGIPYAFSNPQISDPMVPGYMVVQSSKPGADFSITIPGTGYMWWKHVIVSIRKTALAENDTLNLVYGYGIPSPPLGTNPGARVYVFNKNTEFTIEVDTSGNGAFIQIGHSPLVTVKSDQVTELKCIVPSNAKVGDPFNIHVIPRDIYGNIVDQYKGTITFSELDNNNALHYIDKCTPHDNGIRIFARSIARKPGFKRFIVEDKEKGITGISNQMEVSLQEPEWSIYWGDLHGHTELSDGAGTVDEYYLYARDKAHLDFSAISDHDKERMFTRIPKEEWRLFDSVRWKLIQNAARKYYEQNKFVTFLGWEYSERKYGGDVNIYYLNDDEPLFSCLYPEYDHPNKLWAALNGKKVIAIPHMHSRISWDFPDTSIQRLVEIYSVWGNSECSISKGNTIKPRLALEQDKVNQWQGKNVQDALDKGLHLGITAGGDIHDGHPGNSNWLLPHYLMPHAYYWGGLTAVFAKTLTREDIFDALYKRRCYGTTGARILLEFSINGNIMGAELKTSTVPQIFVKVAGTQPIKSIDLIRNNKTIYTYSGSGTKENFHYSDQTIEKGDNYYYVRVIQKDDEMAWSSPIWVTFK